jgi:hypothetical protein
MQVERCGPSYAILSPGHPFVALAIVRLLGSSGRGIALWNGIVRSSCREFIHGCYRTNDDGTVLWFTQTDPYSSDTTSSHASDKSRIGITNSDTYLVFDHSEPRSRRPLTKTALLVMSKWNLNGITKEVEGH